MQFIIGKVLLNKTYTDISCYIHSVVKQLYVFNVLWLQDYNLQLGLNTNGIEILYTNY